MPLKIQVKVDLPAEKLAAEFGLGNDKAGQIFLAKRVRSRCDKYVPYKTGYLKNTASAASDGSSVTYPAPYAAKQYYVDYRHRDPNRGSAWEQRMLRAERDLLVHETKTFLEGRPG